MFLRTFNATFFSAKNALLGQYLTNHAKPLAQWLQASGARLFPPKMISFQAEIWSPLKLRCKPLEAVKKSPMRRFQSLPLHISLSALILSDRQVPYSARDHGQ